MRLKHAWHVSLATLILLTACNRTHQTTVAVIPKASADIFWQSVHAGAVKGGLENRVKIVWDGPPNETDIATEMKIMETMINRQVDAIAVAPSDRSAFKILVDRAIAAHIPVIIYDSAVATDKYTAFVATDNYAAGQLAADRMGEILSGKGKIVMVKTTPGGASTTDREEGFKSRLHSHFPQIEILDERFGMGTYAQSLTVAENMLTAHPDLAGIFSSSESGSAGSAQALKARNVHVKLVGFDSSPTLLTELQDGWIDSLVVQDPFRMGEMAVDQAVRASRGERIPKKIFLPAIVVSSANLHDPDINARLHPDLAKYLGGSF